MRKLFASGPWVFVMIIAISLIFAASIIADTKIYLDIPTEGSRTDGAWSQAWFEAYNYLKTKYPDVEVTFSDLCPYAETSAILETRAQKGVNILYLDSFWLEATQKVAPRYPKTWFILRNLPDSLFRSLSDNVATYATKDHQGAFLAGVAAGMVTKTNTIAYVAGVDYPDIIRAGKGFEEGAKLVNPKVKLLVMYTGDWVDVQKGYEAAKALIQAGADVIMHYSDNAGKGVFQAAKEHNIFVVGEARDQVELAPKLTITSSARL
jgi:basic membrane protein A